MQHVVFTPLHLNTGCKLLAGSELFVLKIEDLTIVCVWMTHNADLILITQNWKMEILPQIRRKQQKLTFEFLSFSDTPINLYSSSMQSVALKYCLHMIFKGSNGLHRWNSVYTLWNS
eukprot:TRINITY_DN655_c0_g1_i3.p1 TRINITY_DN655_c0_g1~~TRINITY_DN655_c0_g1_i3.p1  ORF type:complete len:117 (-),score=3.76 TRINITY_DN655_c0_g1_i3:309-659(-)